MSVQTDYAAIVPMWEGRTSYLYRDTEGNATCGEGIELPDLTESLTLPWLTTMGQPTTAAEMISDWNRVMSMRPGLACTAYQDHQSGLVLSDDAIDQMTLTNVDKVYSELRDRWPDLPTYPEPGQLGLMDMGYNLGVPRLLHEYPEMCLGMDAHGGPQWTVVAAQCGRDTSIKAFAARNAYTKALFLKAANA